MDIRKILNRLRQKSPFMIPLVACVVVLIVLVAVYIAILLKSNPPPEGGTDTEPKTGQSDPGTSGKSEQTDKPSTPETNLGFRMNISSFEAFMNPKNNTFLILANKKNPLGESYVPTDLKKVKDAKKNIELVETAEKALEAMFIEMRAAGFKDVFVTSAYRSYSYQTGLFEDYITREQLPGMTREEAIERVLRYSAEPGKSEHQTGLCVDLMTGNMSALDESFASHPVYPWLVENAWKFGFILRYPADKTGITGYDYEPWHYRFVGRDAAFEIWSKGLCLEEYLGRE